RRAGTAAARLDAARVSARHLPGKALWRWTVPAGTTCRTFIQISEFTERRRQPGHQREERTLVTYTPKRCIIPSFTKRPRWVLHDPVRWKLHHIVNYFLHRKLLPNNPIN